MTRHRPRAHHRMRASVPPYGKPERGAATRGPGYPRRPSPARIYRTH